MMLYGYTYHFFSYTHPQPIEHHPAPAYLFSANPGGASFEKVAKVGSSH